MSLLNTAINGNILTITMCERIDTNNIGEIQSELDAAVSANPAAAVIVDAAKLEYISSIGLRAMLALRKKFDDFRIINASDNVYGIFDMTKFTDLMDVEKAYRNISVENCPLLGKGACGTVYKLDDETIVKVFVDNYDYEKIVRERDNSRNAFTHGIDTAIPFDIVKVGENYGLVYEIINAETLKNTMLKDRTRLDRSMEIYAAYIKHMHSITFESDCYPDMKKIWCEKIDALEGIFTDSQKDTVKNLILELPDRNTFVHGDINFGNLMISDGKAIMIDMEDAMLGHPIFDIAFLYYILRLMPGLLPSDFYESVIGFTAEESGILWNKFCDIYFECGTPEERAVHEEAIHPYGIVKLLEGVPTCYMLFNASEESVGNMAAAVYRPAAEKRRTELFERIANGVKPLTF